MSQPQKSPPTPKPAAEVGAKPGPESTPAPGADTSSAVGHPVEQTAEAALSALRQREGSGPLFSESDIVPGVRLSFDTERGAMEAAHATGAGALLRLSLKVAKPGRWRSLNVSLGGGDLAEGDVIGVVADLAAAAPAEIALSIRAGRGKRFRDTPFDDLFAAGPGGSVHVALHTVAAGTPLADPASWRSLMLRLPPADLDLEIRDLRIFVVPAATVAGMGMAPAVSGAR